MSLQSARLEEHEDLFLVGLAWQGTFSEARKGNIHEVIQKMKSLLGGEFRELYGISIHNIEEGLTHYSAVLADHKPKHLPDELEWLEIPAHTYFVGKHEGKTDVEATYQEVALEIENRNYEPYMTADFPVFDPLPFKIEIFDLEQDINGESEFEIRIPVVRKMMD